VAIHDPPPPDPPLAFHPAARCLLAQHDVWLDYERLVVLDDNDGVSPTRRVVHSDDVHELRRDRLVGDSGFLRGRISAHRRAA
jgi:hypothetical protein